MSSQIIASAWGRLRRSFALLIPEEHARAQEVVRELHALVVEASILALDKVVAPAAQAEAAARLWASTGTSAALTSCVRLTQDMGRVLDRLEAWSPQVLLVDDTAFYRTMLEETLSAEGWLVGVARDAATARDEARRWPPAVLLCDVHLIGCSAKDVVTAVRDSAPNVRVLMISSDTHAQIRPVVEQLAAHGAVSKRDGAPAIVAAIRSSLAISERSPAERAP